MSVSKSLRTYTTLGFYHKFSRLREDTWSRLKQQLKRLLQAGDDEAETRVARRSVISLLRVLERLDIYTAFPSKKDLRHMRTLYNAKDFKQLNVVVRRAEKALSTGSYRNRFVNLRNQHNRKERLEEELEQVNREENIKSKKNGYFELLIIGDFKDAEDEAQILSQYRGSQDDFYCSPVTVSSFEDALIALMINPDIQACMIHDGYAISSDYNYDIFQHYLLNISEDELARLDESECSLKLADVLYRLRPEIDLFYTTKNASEQIASKKNMFKRIFYNEPGCGEQMSSIFSALAERYRTPFFSALVEYSRKPTGVFHALPISRGQSIRKSHWLQDFSNFYGENIFLAETSATSGGLDSLLQPTGPMKEAQESAARAYGARETYFVTNGTSTANKIVVQGLIRPGDVVLVDRDCHKSHHYAMVLMGAQVSYLDSYPLPEYSMYGAVPIRTIKERLLAYKRAGRLADVKMLILTNCTFDGIVYNVQRVMEECLAIKPDLVFLWDEAWFGFARFNPSYRIRTGMHSASTLRDKYKGDTYKQDYQQYVSDSANLDPHDDSYWLDRQLMPDPEKVRIRVYVTQSTHKTLTSLRQGSMIHIYDQDFRLKAKEAFTEAYMTHTSTSPNYQILASLDAGRRQVELEGFELVHEQIEAAMTLREQIYINESLSKFFKVLVNKDMVPDIYRVSGVESYYDPETGWSRMEDAWENDEFVSDPSRITLHIGNTGIDGDTFKNKYLMDKYNIQINKTSRNTVLFMTNIGTERSSVTYLIEVLSKIGREVEQNHEDFSRAERRVHNRRIDALTKQHPPLPDFSYFHSSFRNPNSRETPDGDIRKAYFLSYDEENCEYFGYTNGEIQAEIKQGREVVSASFVTPYPPGFPILVPGQVITTDIIDFLLALDVKEIHGYSPNLGLKVFLEDLSADKKSE